MPGWIRFEIVWGNGSKLKEGRFRLNIRRAFFHEGGDTLEQLVQRSCGYTIPRSVQSWVG